MGEIIELIVKSKILSYKLPLPYNKITIADLIIYFFLIYMIISILLITGVFIDVDIPLVNVNYEKFEKSISLFNSLGIVLFIGTILALTSKGETNKKEEEKREEEILSKVEEVEEDVLNILKEDKNINTQHKLLIAILKEFPLKYTKIELEGILKIILPKVVQIRAKRLDDVIFSNLESKDANRISPLRIKKDLNSELIERKGKFNGNKNYETGDIGPLIEKEEKEGKYDLTPKCRDNYDKIIKGL